MSFGFGVGDILKLIELARKLWQDYSSAPEQYQGITIEVKSLISVLEAVDAFLAEHVLSPEEARVLRELNGSCRQVLTNVQKALDKYSILKPKADDKGRGVREGVRRVWQRVKWEPDDIRNFRLQITSNINLLNAFINVNTGSNLMKLVVRQSEQDRDEVLNWLAPVDYAGQHSTNIRKHIPGTGQWLLDSSEYQTWLSTAGELLLLHGMHGAGKTVLMAMIIDRLQESGLEKTNIGLCYFYCNFYLQSNQGLEAIMLSLLRQLVQSMPGIPSMINELYKKHNSRSTRPRLDEIKQALQLVAKCFSMLYVLVDALDECTDIERRELVTELLDLRKVTNVNILVSFCPSPHTEDQFKDGVRLKIRADDKDLRKFIDKTMKDLPNFVLRSPDLQDQVKQGIVSSADGMFKLATLQMDALKGKTSPGALQDLLTAFENKQDAHNDAYKNAYDKTMELICSQGIDGKDLALEALSWTVFGERLLTAKELLHALATKPRSLKFNVNRISDIEDVIASCCGLIAIEGSYQFVHLTHYTVRTFFTGDGLSWLEGAQSRLSAICISYLSLQDFDGGICHSMEEFVQRRAQMPFYDYASCYWGRHVYLSGDHLIAEKLLKDEAHIAASAQVLMNYRQNVRVGFPGDRPGKLTPLHFIGYFGLDALLDDAVEDYNIDSGDSSQRTCLSYAAELGHTHLADLLIKKGASVDSFDENRRTPLSFAAQESCGPVARLLLGKGARINHCDRQGRSPISYAAQYGTADMFQLLIDAGANLADGDEDGRTALSYIAAHHNGEELVRFFSPDLLDFDKSDKNSRTPLSHAAEINNEKIVRFLLQSGVVIDSPDNRGRTPLWYACIDGSVETTLLLVASGADVTWKDSRGRTPLHIASMRYNLQIIHSLIFGDQPALPNHNNSDEQQQQQQQEHLITIFKSSYGSQNATGVYTKRASTLLSSPDNEGRNPLHFAARVGKVEVLDYLIGLGADASLKDSRGQTLLDFATSSKSVRMVSRVLEICGLPFTNTIWSSLHWVCRNGDFDMLRLLVDAGAKASISKTTDPPTSWAPLDVAIYHGNSNLVTSTGQLLTHHPWSTVAHSCIVRLDSSTNLYVPCRENTLIANNPSHGHRCDGCSLIIVGTRYHCEMCDDFDYCLMCRQGAEQFHPGHQWRCFDADGLD